MEHNYLQIRLDGDKEELAKILFKNGYTVRLTTKADKNGKKTKVVEYWKGEEK